MKRTLLLIGGILWLSGIGVGMGLLWEYALTPGMPARPSERWPAESCLWRINTEAEFHAL